MDQNRQHIIQAIKSASNVLITVSSSPSLDQLSAAMGLALFLNKMDKHAALVFSGQVPSVMNFLNPGTTIAKDTDSLRDFIISLDKAKADKLRYKVEDDMVKIYITPYRTNLSQADLTFSQGDFNVDVVIAVGVDNREHMDQAIVAHGRILHDADVVAIAAGNQQTDVGHTNWIDQGMSSLCEMVMAMCEELQPGQIDQQIATALLTGLVAETDRFKNEKTTPNAMTAAAKLMAAGANQQLIAQELHQAAVTTNGTESRGVAAAAPVEPTEGDLGTIALELSHNEELAAPAATPPVVNAPAMDPAPQPAPQALTVDSATAAPAMPSMAPPTSPEALPDTAPTTSEDLGLPKLSNQMLGGADSSMHRVIQPLNPNLKESLNEAAKPLDISELSLPDSHSLTPPEPPMPSLGELAAPNPFMPGTTPTDMGAMTPPAMPSVDPAVQPLVAGDQPLMANLQEAVQAAGASAGVTPPTLPTFQLPAAPPMNPTPPATPVTLPTPPIDAPFMNPSSEQAMPAATAIDAIPGFTLPQPGMSQPAPAVSTMTQVPSMAPPSPTMPPAPSANPGVVLPSPNMAPPTQADPAGLPPPPPVPPPMPPM